MSEKEEVVEVTLKLPKPVADWFRDGTKNLEERLTAELVGVAWAQVDSADPKLLTKKYGLKPVFQRYKLV